MGRVIDLPRYAFILSITHLPLAKPQKEIMLDHQSGEFLHLGDASIYYETTGPSQGHPVILLHGGLGSLEDFYAIVNFIPETMHVVAVDMRGHGRSTLGIKPLTYQQHQADIQSLISHLGLKNYSLLGFSDGGIVAYRLAAANAEVRALVTIGAQWRISRHDPSFEILGAVTASAWAEMFPEATQKYAALTARVLHEALKSTREAFYGNARTASEPSD